MTSKQIEAKQSETARRTELLFGTAKRIRELLDAAKKEYGAEPWDDDDIEANVLDLVTGEP
jgi:hypothetical protein